MSTHSGMHRGSFVPKRQRQADWVDVEKTRRPDSLKEAMEHKGSQQQSLNTQCLPEKRVCLVPSTFPTSELRRWSSFGKQTSMIWDGYGEQTADPLLCHTSCCAWADPAQCFLGLAALWLFPGQTPTIFALLTSTGGIIGEGVTLKQNPALQPVLQCLPPSPVTPTSIAVP